MQRAKADGDLRKIFREHLPHMHWTPIETALTGSGVPDANSCYNGIEFWVEYKSTSGWSVVIRPEQVGWLYRRARAGGRCFVAVRRHSLGGVRSDPVDDLYIFPGASAPGLRTRTLRELEPLGLFSGGPGRWDWDGVQALLLRSRLPVAIPLEEWGRGSRRTAARSGRLP